MIPRIERLSPELAAALKSVRLEALRDTPSAFGSTYAQEVLLSDAAWRQRVMDWNGPTAACYLALEGPVPCGIIAGYLDSGDAGMAHVASMWVAPAHRRSGLGTRLMRQVQDWAETLNVRCLCLMVTSSNTGAIGFYERSGFIATGRTEPYPNDPALVEYEMVKALGPEIGSPVNRRPIAV